MRIRSIKPEFWRSQDITALPRDCRLLFVGLWSYVDDNGVGIDDFRTIAADLFALEEDPKEARDWVREGLATLSRALLIVRYEVDGRSFIYIPTWDRHQKVDRPNKVRYPRPPEGYTPPTRGDREPRPHLEEVSRQSREDLATGAVEQWSRGTEEQTPFPTAAAPGASDAASPEPARDLDAGFDDFWRQYPRKVQKDDARKAYRQARKKKVPPEVIAAGAARYAEQRKDKDQQFTKYPAAWLRAGGYSDAEVLPFARAAGEGPYRNPEPSAYFDDDPWSNR